MNLSDEELTKLIIEKYGNTRLEKQNSKTRWWFEKVYPT